jgi:hypothetical protein
MTWTWELEAKHNLRPIIWHNNAYWWVIKTKRPYRLGINERQVAISVNYLREN